jgi:pimeloyl-ACP methyl ester carboxylesterase
MVLQLRRWLPQRSLVLVGDNEDEVTAGVHHIESAQTLVDGIPDARLVVLHGEGHSYFFANPEEAHKAIRDFLQE